MAPQSITNTAFAAWQPQGAKAGSKEMQLGGDDRSFDAFLPWQLNSKFNDSNTRSIFGQNLTKSFT